MPHPAYRHWRHQSQNPTTTRIASAMAIFRYLINQNICANQIDGIQGRIAEKQDKITEVAMSALTIEIILGAVVVLALFGFFLRRVSQEQGSVEKLSSEIDSMELQQRRMEAASLKELKRAVDPNSRLEEDDR